MTAGRDFFNRPTEEGAAVQPLRCRRPERTRKDSSPRGSEHHRGRRDRQRNWKKVGFEPFRQ